MSTTDAEVCPACGDIAHADRDVCSMFHPSDGMICTCTGPSEDDASTTEPEP